MPTLASVRRLLGFSGPKPPIEPLTEDVPAPVVAPSPEPMTSWRASRLARLASLSPFAVAIAPYLVAPTFFPPLSVEPPSWLGPALGLAVQAWILTWAALGATFVWQTRAPSVAALALCVFTAPSIVALLFAPALILVMLYL